MAYNPHADSAVTTAPLILLSPISYDHLFEGRKCRMLCSMRESTVVLFNSTQSVSYDRAPEGDSISFFITNRRSLPLHMGLDLPTSPEANLVNGKYAFVNFLHNIRKYMPLYLFIMKLSTQKDQCSTK